MSIKKIKGGWATTHCHGSSKGRIIHKFRTKRAALRQHRAIQAHKRKK